MTTNKCLLILAGLVATWLISNGALAAVTVPTGSPDGQYDQTDVILLITYISLALVFSFLCSIAEATLLSITPSYIANLQEDQPKKAALLKKLKQENIDRSLAAILTLNTIAHTVGAIGSGAKATIVFGNAWFGLFSAIMTLMILFLSEIIPKTLGAVYWRSLAGVTARFVQLLILCLYPLILISEQLTRLVARGKKVHAFNRDEFVAMAGVGEQSGHINERESRIIRNLFQLGSLTTEDVMTPSTVIVTFNEDEPIEIALSESRIESFSRLPIYRESLQHISGFVLKDDMLLAKAESRGDHAMKSLKRDIMTVTADTPLSTLLEEFVDKRQQIARVTGPYGETDGLVTLEDVLETLLGIEIVDEVDEVEDMQDLARQKWAKRATKLGLKVELPGETGGQDKEKNQRSAD